jgi:hypothetical protein
MFTHHTAVLPDATGIAAHCLHHIGIITIQDNFIYNSVTVYLNWFNNQSPVPSKKIGMQKLE